MEVKQIVDKYSNCISERKLFLTPNIPNEKLNNAIRSYGCGVSADEVILLLDDTVWGGAKEGLLMTRSAIYAKEFGCEPISFLLQNIENICNKNMVIYINEKKVLKINMARTDTVSLLPFLINDIVKIIKNKLSGNQPQSNEPALAQTNFLDDSELSKWEKIENDLLDTLTITDKNFYYELHKTILQGHAKNAADKLLAKTTYDLMLIALSFPDVINKDKIFSHKFLQMLHGSEDLSFELLAFVFARIQIILGPHIDRNQLTSILEPFLITIFASYATSKSKPMFEGGTIASLYNDPIKELSHRAKIT